MNKKINKVSITIIKSIKSDPYMWSFGIAVVLIIIPILTWVLYFIGDCGYILINTSLNVGDALGFYGSFLAFLGTVALGALGVYLNKQANEINRRILEHDLIKTNTSILTPTRIELRFANGDGKNAKIKMDSDGDKEIFALYG